MKKASKISLETPMENVGQIHRIRDKIIKKTPRKTLFTISRNELCFYVLNQFDFSPGEINADDSKSLELGSDRIIRLMGLDDDFLGSFEETIPKGSKDPIGRFMYYFLEMDSLPGVHRKRLKELVKSDLDEINALIQEYLKIPFIKNGETPRNQQQRTEHDFYNRCLKEKVKIQDHLKKGINDRALEKAFYYNKLAGIEALFDTFYDRPYRLPLPKSNEYFNHSAIDKVSHRILQLPISKGKILKALYKTDKESFYSELNKILPFENDLDTMLSTVIWLPFVTQQRKYIFEEIVSLYKSKKMFGTYALALTQIEGLFTDMCKLCKPGFNDYKASLPDKVSIVRPYHLNSESRFDYFQYHLPILRNRFLHYGTDSNDKIDNLCHDILYDLIEVVSIFSQLNLDANWLLRLIRKRDDADFMSFEGLCTYLKRLNGVKQKKQFDYFNTEVQNLNENYIPHIVYNLTYDMEQVIEASMNVIAPVVKLRSAEDGFEIDLEKTPIATIVKNPVKKDKNLKQALHLHVANDVRKLLSIDYVLGSYKKAFDANFIENETLVALEGIVKKYKPVLNKIKMICSQLNFEVE